MVFGVMARASHRALRWAVMVTLLIGLLGATGSVVAGSAESSMRESGEGMQHCQWMIPAACCDERLAVSSSPTVVPKPALTVALLAPIHSPGTVSWTPEHASTSPRRVDYATVVLRL